MPVVEKEIPQTIFLICRDEDGEMVPHSFEEGWTWCEDDIYGTGEKYVLASDVLKFLEELADHIAYIDCGCDFCIERFLSDGETAWPDEPPPPTHGGVNELLAQHFPKLQYEHIRSRKVGEKTKVRLVVGDG